MTAAELKASILDRAVHGLLVPQDPNDEPAAKSSTVENPPYDLPRGWVWVRLGDICTLINGRAYKQTELLAKGKYPVLRVGNFFSNPTWYYSNLELEPEKYCNNGDLLFAWSASFGPRIWNGTKTIFHYHIWKCNFNQKSIIREYLFLWFNFFCVNAHSSTSMTHGVSMAHLTKESMEREPIPLPPLAEQKRIVAKIEELMPLVEEYGKAETELAALNENFPTALRKSILQHAVEGKLLPKSATWKEVKIKDIAKMYGGFAFKSTDYKKCGIQVVRISDLDDTGVSTHDPVYYAESQDLEKYLIPHNAILICLTGSIGKMTWVKDNKKRYLNQRVGMLIFNDDRTIPYAWIFLHTPAVLNSWIAAKTSTNGNIKNSDVTDLTIPLPPLAEQKAIVERVEELLGLVEKMKE